LPGLLGHPVKVSVAAEELMGVDDDLPGGYRRRQPGVVSLSTLVGLVSQNFLVLYGFIIVAFVRTEAEWFPVANRYRGPRRVAFFFPVQVFCWWMAYPTALLGRGVLGQPASPTAVCQQSLSPKARNY